MANTIVALYDEMEIAEKVVNGLLDIGFAAENISMLMGDTSGKYAVRFNVVPRGFQNDESATMEVAEEIIEEDVSSGEGAGFGAVIGALVGLGTMLIPGIGPVVAAGPIASALIGAGVGAATGAVTGGLVAALVNFGVDAEQAEYYAEGVRRGSTLVIIHTTEANHQDAMQVVEAYKPIDLAERAQTWRSGGWKGFDVTDPSKTQILPQVNEETADAYQSMYQSDASQVTGYGAVEDDFRLHYSSMFNNSGHPYAYYSPAYYYGYVLAGDPRYMNHDWAQLEPHAREGWEKRSDEDGTWEDIKDAVRHAWESIRNAVR